MADPHPATDPADADAQAYQRGSMEINEQSATWDIFMGLTKWGSLGVAVLVLFLTQWFRPGGGFLVALVSAVVVLAVGFVSLKSAKPAH